MERLILKEKGAKWMGCKKINLALFCSAFGQGVHNLPAAGEIFCSGVWAKTIAPPQKNAYIAAAFLLNAQRVYI
jgi:hypothetical protein